MQWSKCIYTNLLCNFEHFHIECPIPDSQGEWVSYYKQVWAEVGGNYTQLVGPTTS